MMRHLPGSLCLFLAGLALNQWRHVGELPHARRVLLIVTLLYLTWLYLLSQHPRALVDGSWATYAWEPVVGLLIAGIVYLVVHPSNPARWLGSKPLLLLGTWSYGIYLWHFPVLRLLPRTVPGPWKTMEGSLLALLICVLASLLLAALSYYAVERPALNAIARWQSRPKTIQ
jgi:peptidoglycan/LPS O-acetylase OafA/YrhL